MKQLITFFILMALGMSQLWAKVQADDTNFAARYSITEQMGFQITSSQMQFSVFNGHVVRELPMQNIIEHWVKRDNGRHVFYRHFPTHDASIYYNRGDLRAMNLASDWQTIVQVIPSQWLSTLEKAETIETAFGQAIIFQGTIGGYQVTVEWLEGLSIPYKYTIRQQHQRLTLELTDFDQDVDLIDKLVTWDRYRSIDFSDAMDMERDGFVQYLISTGQLETGGVNLHFH
ncbi:hypothetical protein [Vibrio sp. WXL103]|uniref:hypothetical protein n=1 Tax=Vibrio sp. WXL103 TaxID=3450710 RepID=UPI003EC4AE8F